MKEAKLFMNGQSQAVRLPKEFRFEGKSVGIQRVGRSVVLTPLDNHWQEWFNSFAGMGDDFFPNGRNQGPQQERELLFDD